ncbi:MAG: hypothetical protein IJX44_04330 [Bacteroidaceae bacterium]|nr:hypothetical protein [Bacteroidaceae bacterium]
MKVVINCILAACVAFLLYICVGSIMGPVNFEKEKGVRQSAIVESLINIRDAQVNYRNIKQVGYCDNIDSLVAFVKTAKLPIVKKEGELTDEQMENGITEASAVAMIEKARKTGKWDEVKKNKLEGFSRDTMFVSLKDSLFGKEFNADSMAYVPYGKGAKFEMETRVDSTRSGTPLYLFEARTPFEVWLGDLNKQELLNLIDKNEKMGRYCGLKVGDVEEPNNNAGNWE